MRVSGVMVATTLMDHDNSILGVVRRHLEATGYLATLQSLLPPGADIEQGFQELRLAAAKLGLEIYEAEVRGVPLATAVGDEHNFPNLFRVHVGLRDMFTLEMPKALVPWVERAMAGGVAGPTDNLQLQLGRMATDGALPPAERARARFALFELLRMALFFAEYLERGQLTALGVSPRHLDELAEQKLNYWLTLEPEHTADVRPLNVMMAAAMEDLTRQGQALAKELLTVSADLVNAVRGRQALEERLQEMNTPDALLVRNAAAGEGLLDDEQYVTIETLQEQHPFALGDLKRNTLDQRYRRLIIRIADGDWPKRKSPAVIDLALKQLPTGDKEQ